MLTKCSRGCYSSKHLVVVAVVFYQGCSWYLRAVPIEEIQYMELQDNSGKDFLCMQLLIYFHSEAVML